MRLWEPLLQSQSYGVGTSTDSCPQATVAVVGSLSPASGLSVASRMAAFCVGPQRLHEPSVCTRASRLVRVCDLRRSNRGSDWATARPYRTAGLDRCTRGTACLVLSRVVPAPPGRVEPWEPRLGPHGRSDRADGWLVCDRGQAPRSPHGCAEGGRAAIPVA